mgnify:CR=1 FL=1
MLAACLFASGLAFADDIYQEPQVFLSEAFGDDVPEPKVLWLSDEHRTAAAQILQHSPHMLRVRYWQSGHRTAWILDEIGKERPITVGIVVDEGAIDQVGVLIYRESIGWEVRHRFFTQQFDQAKLNERLMLTKPIDGIVGATLSVRAVTGLARLAVYFDSVVDHGS